MHRKPEPKLDLPNRAGKPPESPLIGPGSWAATRPSLTALGLALGFVAMYSAAAPSVPKISEKRRTRTQSGEHRQERLVAKPAPALPLGLV